MVHNRIASTGFVVGMLLCTGGLAWAGADAGASRTDQDIDRHTFVELADQTAARAFERDGRRMSVYGRPMAHGVSSQAAADSFVTVEAERLFGVAANDLKPGVMYADGAHVKGLMFDRETGEYGKLLHRYTQHVNGVPVFESELKLLVLNQPDYPVVLANSSLHDLGAFRVDPAALQLINPAQALAVAVRELGAGAVLLEGPSPMVYAGEAAEIDIPTLGARFIASEGLAGTEDYQRWVFIIEPATGRILYRDSQVLNIDVTGNVSANATMGFRSELCDPDSVQAMPYARVNIGGTIAFADENGDFLIPNGGSSDVTVQSRVWGRWFRAINFQGADALLQEVVTPPGPVNFLHNPTSAEQTSAEVNAYITCNEIRDHVLELDPSFPVIQTDFAYPLHVNDSGSCNAFYQTSNLLFLRSGGNCPNTAYSSIVYHEYGHHIVAIATGSQCQWGEGNADVTAIQVSDESELAFGFFGDCNTPLRDGDNDCQYDSQSCSSCGGPCHSCGQLISGCFWDMRSNLLASDPNEYRTIGGQLWLASLFMHTGGQSITPQVTIDYLMADDNDGNLENGTPHYFQIANAFTGHNMAPPPLILLTFNIPGGAPGLISPNGDQTVQLEVAAANGDPKPDSGVLYFDEGAGVVEVPMTEIENNVYEGTFPASTCGSTVTYYFSVDTDSDITVFFPITAPSDRFLAVSAVDEEVAFADDFEADLGWTVENSASSGIWERVTPDPDCERGAPAADADGSGMCYVTDDDPGCFRDVSFGTTTLTSPQLDASNAEAIVSYYRWYDNSRGGARDDAFVVELSDDNGGTWSPLESVGPTGVEAEGGWYFKTFRIGDFVGNTDEFRIRFIASDINPVSIVEAAVDGVIVRNLICGCAEDLDGSGSVDFGDINAVLSAWGNAGGPEDLNGSGTVEFGDLLIVISNWGPCV